MCGTIEIENVIVSYVTLVAALVHRQMHLLVVFRSDCTTEADHAIDLSP